MRDVPNVKEVRGVIPDTGFSHVSVARKRVTKRTRCEHGQTGASHTTHHKHLSTDIVPAVIPSKGAFSERFKFVEEVVVLATIMKVAVFGVIEEVVVFANLSGPRRRLWYMFIVARVFVDVRGNKGGLGTT